MNTPNPDMPSLTPPSGWRPTGSTVASGAAGMGTIVVMGLCRAFGHPIDEMTASAITGLLMLAANYLHPAGGRQ